MKQMGYASMGTDYSFQKFDHSRREVKFGVVPKAPDIKLWMLGHGQMEVAKV